VYLIPTIIDSDLPFSAHGGSSVLALPLATGTVLDYLVGRLCKLGCQSVVVISNRAGQADYCPEARPQTLSRSRIVGFKDLGQVIGACEASDYLLVVEPRQWPAAGYDFVSIGGERRHYRGATHLIAVGNAAPGPRERVECDATGQIRRVQRVYDSVTWPGSTAEAVFCSVVPAQAVCDTEFRSLSELRGALAEKGIFTQDMPVASTLWDLSRQTDIIALNRQMVSRAVVEPEDPAFRLRSPGVLVGRDCVVHHSARIIAPVILHDRVQIGEDAVLVGPVVVGPRVVVSEKAVVAQSVLGADTIVTRHTRVCHRVVLESGESDPEASGILAAAPVRPAAMDARAAAWETSAPGGRRHVELAVKRAVDIVLACLGLVLLAPLLAVVAVLVKLTSPGPAFFVHRREGRGGREFGCIKFRTMVVDAHARQRELYQQNLLDGPQFKMDDDPRVTRIGAWLRRTNVDELPQLINVVAGHMSLVGPRPSPFRENQICVPWRLARLSVRPGITGVWQICRDRRSDGDFHQWIYYDLAYVRHFSVWLDIKILWHTMASKGGRKTVALSKLIRTNGSAEQHPDQNAVIGQA
jgi:lipopolysaccharide/colanic/teichoic acid biosynthesis glycosyltransferase